MNPGGVSTIQSLCNCEAMYTSCRDQAPVEYVRGSLLLSTDGLPQW
eukprot:COSAG03_NODE_8209_length_826_cov_0.837689_1_plen_45_part_10